MSRYVRVPKLDSEIELFDNGWRFAGFTLFQHPDYPRQYFTLDGALKCNNTIGYYITDDRLMQLGGTREFMAGVRITTAIGTVIVLLLLAGVFII